MVLILFILVIAKRHVIIPAMKKFIIIVIIGVAFFACWKTVSVLFFKKDNLDFSGVKTFHINEDGHLFAASARASTISDFLEGKQIEIGEHDMIFPEPEAKLLPGMTIEINRALPIEIDVDDGKIQHRTFQRDVESALREAGVILSHLDKIEPERNTGIEKNLEIVVTRINVEQVIETESIKFKTVEKEDDDLKWKKKKVKQEGEKGTKEVVYEVTYKNGKQVSKKKMSSEVVKDPIDEVVTIGTKVEVGKEKVGIASWYAYTGTMACASRMFPKGTWLRVTNRENGKQVFVVVNDYGPQRGTGKMIDLDKVAFAKLASIGKGVIEVKVEEILE